MNATSEHQPARKRMENQIANPASMSVFITGATNALGRMVTRRLVAAGHLVTGVAGGSAGAAQVRADGGLPAYPDLLRAGELRSAIAAAEAKVVMHLAPQSANEIPQAGAQFDERLLGDGTAALLDGAQAAGVEFVIFASYAFADTNDDDLVALTRAARAAEKQALEREVPGCVLRMGFIYGPDSIALQNLRDTLKLGRPVIAGPSDSRLFWTHAADAASALIMAAEKRPAGAVLNIVDSQPASPAAFLNYFAEAQGLNPPGVPGFAKRLLANRTQMALMRISPHVDSSAAQQQLGWSPQFASYQQGIDDLLLSWRAGETV
jgi:nucleoside-diphosphate-sugar epimerase